MSAATESKNSVTKIKPNTPNSAYHVARPGVRLPCFQKSKLGRSPPARNMDVDISQAVSKGANGLTFPPTQGPVTTFKLVAIDRVTKAGSKPTAPPSLPKTKANHYIFT
ncbi:hypothetical protein EVAR_20347_1 [Eumeta japonica]|uniref:Uncharacterized protein n=1 Tax=Eumeta variegata TaxID=151549 RepID=A0A4C1VS89_EUMVA|nr:hypothetical protein EVAR_20347_1 [Eumeta japonica]